MSLNSPARPHGSSSRLGSSVPAAAGSHSPQKGIGYEEETPSCPVCLNDIVTIRERAVVVGCMHVFCLPCLRTWSLVHNKRACPLCKGDIRSFLWDVRGDKDYKEVWLAPVAPSSSIEEPLSARISDILASAFTDLGHHRLQLSELAAGGGRIHAARERAQQRQWGRGFAAGRDINRPVEPRPYYWRLQQRMSASLGRQGVGMAASLRLAEDPAIGTRRAVYQQDIWAEPLPVVPHAPVPAPGAAAHNERYLEEWIDRELRALLLEQDVTVVRAFVVGLIRSFGLERDWRAHNLTADAAQAYVTQPAANRRRFVESDGEEGEGDSPAGGGGDAAYGGSGARPARGSAPRQVQSPAVALRDFIGEHAAHFWHELRMFSLSHLTVAAYDRRVTYQAASTLPHHQGPLGSPSLPAQPAATVLTLPPPLQAGRDVPPPPAWHHPFPPPAHTFASSPAAAALHPDSTAAGTAQFGATNIRAHHAAAANASMGSMANGAGLGRSTTGTAAPLVGLISATAADAASTIDDVIIIASPPHVIDLSLTSDEDESGVGQAPPSHLTPARRPRTSGWDVPALQAPTSAQVAASDAARAILVLAPQDAGPPGGPCPGTAAATTRGPTHVSGPAQEGSRERHWQYHLRHGRHKGHDRERGVRYAGRGRSRSRSRSRSRGRSRGHSRGHSRRQSRSRSQIRHSSRAHRTGCRKSVGKLSCSTSSSSGNRSSGGDTRSRRRNRSPGPTSGSQRRHKLKLRTERPEQSRAHTTSRQRLGEQDTALPCIVDCGLDRWRTRRSRSPLWVPQSRSADGGGGMRWRCQATRDHSSSSSSSSSVVTAGTAGVQGRAGSQCGRQCGSGCRQLEPVGHVLTAGLDGRRSRAVQGGRRLERLGLMLRRAPGAQGDRVTRAVTRTLGVDDRWQMQELPV